MYVTCPCICLSIKSVAIRSVCHILMFVCNLKAPLDMNMYLLATTQTKRLDKYYFSPQTTLFHIERLGVLSLAVSTLFALHIPFFFFSRIFLVVAFYCKIALSMPQRKVKSVSDCVIGKP